MLTCQSYPDSSSRLIVLVGLRVCDTLSLTSGLKASSSRLQQNVQASSLRFRAEVRFRVEGLGFRAEGLRFGALLGVCSSFPNRLLSLPAGGSSPWSSSQWIPGSVGLYA